LLKDRIEAGEATQAFGLGELAAAPATSLTQRQRVSSGRGASTERSVTCSGHLLRDLLLSAGLGAPHDRSPLLCSLAAVLQAGPSRRRRQLGRCRAPLHSWRRQDRPSRWRRRRPARSAKFSWAAPFTSCGPAQLDRPAGTLTGRPPWCPRVFSVRRAG